MKMYYTCQVQNLDYVFDLQALFLAILKIHKLNYFDFMMYNIYLDFYLQCHMNLVLKYFHIMIYEVILVVDQIKVS